MTSLLYLRILLNGEVLNPMRKDVGISLRKQISGTVPHVTSTEKISQCVGSFHDPLGKFLNHDVLNSFQIEE